MGVDSILYCLLIYNAQQAPFGHNFQMKWNMFSNIKVTKFGIEILETAVNGPSSDIDSVKCNAVSKDSIFTKP